MDLKKELKNYLKENKNIKLSDAIFDVLLSAILMGKLAPDAKINMLNLSNTFEVSISPIKYAVLKLNDIGLVQFNKNKGAFITIFDKQDYMDMFYFRMTLEALAASQAATLMTTEELRELFSLAKKIEKLSNDFGISESDFPILPMEVSKADIHFHSYVVEHSKNPYLIKQYKKLYPKIYFSHRFVTVIENLNYIDEHYCLAYSMMSRDPDVAHSAFLHHTRIALYFYEQKSYS
jgi:DNA-binding GntR family transcriptional regulator